MQIFDIGRTFCLINFYLKFFFEIKIVLCFNSTSSLGIDNKYHYFHYTLWFLNVWRRIGYVILIHSCLVLAVAEDHKNIFDIFPWFNFNTITC